MKAKIFVCFLAFLAALGGCKKREGTQGSKADPCSLLTSAEIEAVQGSPIKETKSSEHSEAGLRVSQCYFAVEPSGKSISLAVTQADSADPGRRAPKDYWQETFAKRAVKSEAGEEGGEGERESAAPTKIDGVGEDACWIGNRVGGALYALKKDVFIRISVGGPDDQKTKIDKSKTLAQKALDRL